MDATDKPLPDELTRIIDARADQLREEFSQHLQTVGQSLTDSHGWLLAAEGGLDANRVFQGWMFSKLASLQLLVEDLMDDKLAGQRTKKPGHF